MKALRERLLRPPVLIQAVSTIALGVAVLMYGYEHISGYVFSVYMLLSLLTNWWATKG